MTVRADGVGYAPRGLNREEAARWIGVSPTKFDELIKSGRMPKPKRIDGRVIWDRLKLDAAFSDLGEDGYNKIDALFARRAGG
jgi:predicted DNA-binding transcriptional regulator AlpA